MPPNKSAFASELAAALPRQDPWPGRCEGDELRVIDRQEARKYLDGLFAKFGLLSVDAVLAYKRKAARVVEQFDSIDELMGAWLSGDSAVIVRLRKDRPVGVAFVERITPARVRWNYVIGALGDSGTAFKTFKALGVQECVALVSIPKVLARLREQGYKDSTDGYLVLSL